MNISFSVTVRKTLLEILAMFFLCFKFLSFVSMESIVLLSVLFLCISL
jgi:hypothetical protein